MNPNWPASEVVVKALREDHVDHSREERRVHATDRRLTVEQRIRRKENVILSDAHVPDDL